MDNKNFKEKISEINKENIDKQKEEKEKIRKDLEENENAEKTIADLLLEGIINNIERIVEIDNIKDPIMKLTATMDHEQVKQIISLIQSFSVFMVYNSILLYDDLLKDEIQKQLDHIGKHINLSKSDIEALKAAIKIHTKDLSRINEYINIEKFKKSNNIK